MEKRSGEQLYRFHIAAGEEIKVKDAVGNTVTVGHYIGIMLDTVENVRLKDFTLQVHKRNDFYADMTLAGDGKSIYGIYGMSSHDIFSLTSTS